MENLFDITSARKFSFSFLFHIFLCLFHTNLSFHFYTQWKKFFSPFYIFFHFHFVPSTHLLFSVQQHKEKVNLKKRKKKKLSDRNFSIKTILFFSSFLCFVWLSCSLLKVAKVVKKNVYKLKVTKTTNKKTKQTKQNYKK